MFYVITSIPAIIISVIFGFWPWGLVSTVITVLVFAILPGLIPKKSYIRSNIKLAAEGLSYGKLEGAKDHILLALTDAESSSKLATPDFEALRSACTSLSKALRENGQEPIAEQIMHRYERIASKSAPIA